MLWYKNSFILCVKILERSEKVIKMIIDGCQIKYENG